MKWKVALNLLGVSAWSGAVCGAILGIGFSVLLILQTSLAYDGSGNPGQLLQILSPPDLLNLLALIYIFSIFGGLGILIGAVGGSLVGSVVGVLIHQSNQVEQAHTISAILGFIIMGAFCYQMIPLFLTIGLLIGGSGGLYSGKKFQSFLKVSV